MTSETPGGRRPTSEKRVSDTHAADRVLLETRVLAACIVPFLLVAFAILFLFPGDTEQLFAWTIRPTMTAMLMGAGYLAGAYFFLRVVREQRWHRVGLGFLAVTAFASSMAIATVAHWDRFNHQHPSFWVWVGLYATTPALVLAAWVRNQRTDTGGLEADDVVVSTPLRALVGLAGAVNLATAVVLVTRPDLMIGLWPWQLTALTARVIGGWFALPGVVGLAVAADGRWSAARVVLQSQMLGIVLILIGMLRAWSDFTPSSVSTWLFAIGLTGLLVLLMLLYAIMEQRQRATRRVPSGRAPRAGW